MPRKLRTTLIAAGALAALVLILALAALLIIQTAWFHNQVRQKMVETIEKATGAKSEIGGYSFDWRHLTARVNGFVLHGTEPAGSPPLVRATSITAGLKILSVFQRKVDLERLEINQPRIYILVRPDGTTNVPEPKVKRTTKKSTLENILDLAVKHFTVENGLFTLNDQARPPFQLRAENLRAVLGYQLAGPRYEGQVAMDPLYVTWPGLKPFPLTADVKLAIEHNQLRFASARFANGRSTLDLSGALTNLGRPEGRFRYDARADLADVRRILAVSADFQGRVQVAGDASLAGFANFSVTGSMHAAGVGVQQGALRLRDFTAESAVSVNAEKAHWTGLRLSAMVLPPAARKREMVRAEGRIEDVAFTFKTENFDVHRIQLATLGGTIAGDAGIRKFATLRFEGTVTGFDAARVVPLYSARTLPWDGKISGPVKLEAALRGRAGLNASAQLTVSPAAAGAPVTGSIHVDYDSRRGILDLGDSWLALPATNVRFSGVLGKQLKVRLDSKNLDDILPAAGVATAGPKAVPIKLQNGQATFEGTVSGELTAPQIAGHVTGTNFVYDGRPFDSAAADVQASPSRLQLSNATLARGKLQARLEGSLGLEDWKASDRSAISGSGSTQNASIADLLAVIGQKSFPAAGTFHAAAQVSGAIGDPRVAGEVHVTGGRFEDEPFDRLDARVSYAGNTLEVAGARVIAAAKQVDLTAAWQHAAGNFQSGRLRFQVATNAMPLEQIHTIAKDRPGVKGTLQVNGNGALAIAKAASANITARISELHADIKAAGLQINEQRLGDAHLTANSEGSDLVAHLESNFANSAIRGDGRWRLADDYPGSAQIAVASLDLARLRDWLSPSLTPRQFPIAGSAQASATIEGPAFQPGNWKGTLRVPQLEVGPPPDTVIAGNRTALTIRNSGPVEITLQNSVVRIASAHFLASGTDFTVAGSVALKQRNPLDVKIQGRIGLALLQDFNRDIISSGEAVADAEIRGSFERPQYGGRLELKNIAINYTGFPNGLSNGNGVILFSGTRASIQSLTAETGGGKLNITGFAGSGEAGPVFHVQIKANDVRVRYPEGVSTVADADLTLNGTTENSVLAGEITVLRTGFNPRTDLASVLAKSSEPVRAPSAEAGFLSGLHFDVAIESSPDISVQSSLAQNVQMEASLRLRGTALNPALLGRATVTQGQLIFFGTRFTIDQGSISFFNPVKIEPVLNIDLETKARGVDVILTVSGPLNKLNLTPRSDPPLQFSEIIALLATGRSPTSDPLLLSQQPVSPGQSWQQMGASALLGQALANPVAGRLQRFFGVTKLRIDPTLTGIENNPQARITIEQQVTPEITFTYITNVTSSNPQVVRMEWAINKTWSVVVLREENGLFGIDFLYKKRFK